MQPGQVVKDRDFKTKDGTILPKYYVVLGIDASLHINVRTTSRGNGRSSKEGCDTNNYTFFVPKGKASDCFPEDTWIQLHEIYPMSLAKTIQSGMQGRSYLKGILPKNILKALLICATHSEDISQDHIDILNQAIQLL